jgi:hypothetical protein
MPTVELIRAPSFVTIDPASGSIYAYPTSLIHSGSYSIRFKSTFGNLEKIREVTLTVTTKRQKNYVPDVTFNIDEERDSFEVQEFAFVTPPHPYTLSYSSTLVPPGSYLHKANVKHFDQELPEGV